jgi:hypothetical protein
MVGVYHEAYCLFCGDWRWTTITLIDIWDEVSDLRDISLFFSVCKRGLPVILFSNDCEFLTTSGAFFVLVDLDPVLNHLPVLFRNGD